MDFADKDAWIEHRAPGVRSVLIGLVDDSDDPRLYDAVRYVLGALSRQCENRRLAKCTSCGHPMYLSHMSAECIACQDSAVPLPPPEEKQPIELHTPWEPAQPLKREAVTEPVSPPRQTRPSFDATCSACGATFPVPFQPTPGRNIYCPQHLVRDAVAAERLGRDDFKDFREKRNKDRVHRDYKSDYDDGYHGMRRDWQAAEQNAREEDYQRRADQRAWSQQETAWEIEAQRRPYYGDRGLSRALRRISGGH